MEDLEYKNNGGERGEEALIFEVTEPPNLEVGEGYL